MPEREFTTFEEAARKFKPGPTAPPESDADRPRMGGGSEPRVDNGPRPRGVEFVTGPTADLEGFSPQPDGLGMPEGRPGEFRQMPGDDER